MNFSGITGKVRIVKLQKKKAPSAGLPVFPADPQSRGRSEDERSGRYADFAAEVHHIEGLLREADFDLIRILRDTLAGKEETRTLCAGPCLPCSLYALQQGIDPAEHFLVRAAHPGHGLPDRHAISPCRICADGLTACLRNDVLIYSPPDLSR